jgi:hypothetical protein
MDDSIFNGTVFDGTHQQHHTDRHEQHDALTAILPNQKNIRPLECLVYFIAILHEQKGNQTTLRLISLGMSTLLDPVIRDQIQHRIAALTPSNPRQWGKMSVSQMVQHNLIWNAWMLGKKPYRYKQEWIGRLFGKWALRRMIRDQQPIAKNIPTSRQFIPSIHVSAFEEDKVKWQAFIKCYADLDNPAFVHDFFGKMTKEEMGILAYKHSDHHLRQFGV